LISVVNFLQCALTDIASFSTVAFKTLVFY